MSGVEISDTEPIAPQSPPTTQIEPQPFNLTWKVQQGVFAYGSKSVTDQCQAQPADLWCSDVPLPEITLKPYDIIELSLEVQSHFIYKSDDVDTWRVHTSEALMKQNWYGDCDDLASTTLDVLIRAGQPRSKAWMVLADVRHTAVLDHMIGMVQDVDGHFWIVGDTSYQNAYPADRVKYRIVAIARMDAPTIWMDPHMVGAFAAKNLQNIPITPPKPVFGIDPDKFQVVK